MKRWDGLLDGYLRDCEARGLAASTVKSRCAELTRWGVWLKRRRPRPELEKVDSEMVIEYIRHRAHFHARASVNGMISHLRGMGDHLVRQGVWPANPLRWIQGPKMDSRMRQPKRIGKAHLTALWNAAAQKKPGFPRTRAMGLLSVLYGTGVRRGELERLDVNDWSREEGTLLVDGQKTGCERRVPVPTCTAQCLEAWLPSRQNVLEKTGHQKEGALFLGRRGQRLTGNQIGLMIHRLARHAGVPLVTLHQFRHTCASDLFEEGLTLPQVQGVLGHAAITSTMWYLSLSDPDLKRAVCRHPLGEILKEMNSGAPENQGPQKGEPNA